MFVVLCQHTVLLSPFTSVRYFRSTGPNGITYNKNFNTGINLNIYKYVELPTGKEVGYITDVNNFNVTCIFSVAKVKVDDFKPISLWSYFLS